MKTWNALSLISLIVTILFTSLTGHTALYDRGNGMIYDSTQNITWLQDANYAKTSGYGDGYDADANGRMTYYQAATWAGNLVFGGFIDWRLPSPRLIGADYGSLDTSDDLRDYGYNTRSELGHLFYELGNLGWFSAAGVPQPGFGVTHTSFTDAVTGQSVSLLNLQNDAYWEDVAEAFGASNTSNGWYFQTNIGSQRTRNKSDSLYAWAVRDGDVVAMPVPAAAWLMGSALVGLAGVGRRRKAA